MANKREIGTIAENLSADYLKENGYIILEKNFRCRTGEIDIIANDKDYVVFIEVKYRRTDIKGVPCEAVNINKQRIIIEVAKNYLVANNLYDNNCRFDVVEVSGNLENAKIHLIKNAFEL